MRIEQKIDQILAHLQAKAPTVPSTELLSDPTRRAVFELCDGKHPVGQIVEALRSSSIFIGQPRVSQILSELKNAGLIDSKRGPGEKWRVTYYVQVKLS